jgi:hypothetical protein
MMALKHMSTASQAMQSKYDVQKLAAVVYLAGGSLTIPMAQIEEANFIFGDSVSFYQKLLSTPAIQKWETSGWETWANHSFEVEVMNSPIDLSVTIHVKTKEIQFNGFDFSAGDDMTTISLVKPKMEYLDHYDISGKHTKVAIKAEKGGPLLSGAPGSFTQEFDKALLGGFSNGKKVSGLDSIHWLFVGGPAHGETRWIKGNVSVISMPVTEPLIPKGHTIPPGKHPMMMHKQIQYQGHDLVVDGYRYRIGVQTQEDFNTVPMDEFGKYIEEVGLTPYAQY